MRVFVAVNPPPHMCRELTLRLDTARSLLPLAWTATAAWHLTLMFLGTWPAARLPALVEALRAAVSGHRCFAVEPGRVGAFPDLLRPRVLFLHLEGGEPLRRLAGDVRSAVDAVWPQGPQDQRAFRPHLTLARIKKPLGSPEFAVLRGLDLGTWEPFPLTEVLLLASELRREGARYTGQAAFPLDG